MTQAQPTGDHRGQLERLARRSAASSMGAGINAVFGVALVVIITNGFSREVAGVLFAATAAFLIVESVVLLGTDTGLVKWLPDHLASGRARDVRNTLILALGPVILLAFAVGAIAFTAAPALASTMVGPEQADDMSAVLRVLALLLPVATAYDALQAATRGMGTMRPTVLVEDFAKVGLQAAAVLAVALSGLGVLGLTLAWSLPYVAGLAATAAWLVVLLRRRARVVSSSARGWRPVAREFWSFTAPRAIARVTQTMLKRSDIVLVAALASPADAALYTAATRFVAFGQLLVQAVQQALAPHLSRLFALKEVGAVDSIFRAATVWTMLLAWPLYLLIAAFAPTLMLIFGQGYDEAHVVVTVLALTMLLATACGPVDSVLLMAGRSWLSLFNTGTALVVNLVLNLLLIPLYGIQGAAASWAIAIVIRNLLPLAQVRRHLGLWPGTRAAGYVALWCTLCFGFTAALPRSLGLSFLSSLPFVAAGGVVYVFSVWRMRGPLNLIAFRAALHRGGSRGSGEKPASTPVDPRQPV